MNPVRITPVVKMILIACVAGFVLQKTGDQFLGTNLMGWLGLVPSQFVFGFKLWQIFTYVFLHGDIWHLVFNALMLVFLGSELEGLWGSRRFARFFFASSTAAGIVFLILIGTIWGGSLDLPLVGASGGIYGLLLAYGVFFADRQMLFMMMFPMKAKQFVWILGGIELMTSLFSGNPGSSLSSIAHLGGMIGGGVYLWGAARWKQRNSSDRSGWSRGPSQRKKSGAQHLKLVVNPKDSEDTGKSRDPKSWN